MATCLLGRVMADVDVAVIGAGPGGLAVAAELGRRAVSTIVLDKAGEVGNSWRGYYEGLRMHTVRWTSHLPGYKIPRSYGTWVSRDDVVRYLEEYAEHHRLNVRLGVEVDRLDRNGDEWRLAGTGLASRIVVVATGYSHTPDLPNWPGRDGFTGELLHASGYRNAQPFAGRDVLVVGSGNTGTEIAVDLVEGGAARVRMAVRTVPTIVRRQASPLPNSAVTFVWRRLPVRAVGRFVALSSRLGTPDLSAHGLPRTPAQIYAHLQREGVVPIIDVGFIDAVRAGQVEIVQAVTGFDGAQVRLASGELIAPDAVIAATGYRRGLERLVGHLGVLDDRGLPALDGPATQPGAPGLYFTGLTNPLSDSFRELRLSAGRIAKAIAEQLSLPWIDEAMAR